MAESGSESLYSDAEEVSEEEEVAEEEDGEGGSGTANKADSESFAPRRAPSPPKNMLSSSIVLGCSLDGMSMRSVPHQREKDGEGDGSEKEPEPSLNLDSMEVGETPCNLQPAAAVPPGVPASNASSFLLLREKSDSDSEMDFATVKNIRKQHTSTNNTGLSKRRKKDRREKSSD